MVKIKNISAFVVSLLLLCADCMILSAQNPAGSDPEAPGIQQILEPVKIDGIELFRVRGISSFTAAERASAIGERIKEAAADPLVMPDSVKVVPMSDHLAIYAGTRFIVNIYDGDAEIENVKKETLAQIISNRTVQTIERFRHERSRPVLIRKSFTALGALILMSVILTLITWFFRKVNRRLQRRMKAGLDEIENKSYSLIQTNYLWKSYNLAFRLLRIIIIVLVVAFSFNYILGLFPWTNNVAIYTLKILINPVVTIGQGLINFIPNLAFLAVIYLVTRYLLKLGKMLFKGIQQGGITLKGFDPEWSMPTYRILRILVLAFSLVLAYPYIPGSNSSAFKGISVFAGLLLSLGSSSFISNVIAGYSITYRSAFKIGDRIRVDNHEGFVEEQKLLVTRLRTIKNEDIVLPNSLVLNSSLINYSARARKSGLIIHTNVGIGYETPWRQVDSMLKEAANRTEGLLKDPPPFVLKLSLGDFAVLYQINGYCDEAITLEILYTRLHENILDVFNENNVQIMTPAYMADPEKPKVVPGNKWDIPLLNRKNKD
jgi:small-conductance mechanosensitive channel